MNLINWPNDFHTGLLELAKGGNLNAQELKEKWDRLMDFKRRHLPCSLLRFRPIQNENDLKFRKSEIDGVLYFSDVREQNDPFDASLLSMESDNPIYSGLVKIITTEVKNSGFIACFSACSADSNDTLPMWAHYANDYKGCCMKYDDICLWPIEWQDALFPVKYRPDFQDFLNEFRKDDNSWKYNYNAIYKYVMTNKFDCWSYENEWRIILDNKLLRKQANEPDNDIRIFPNPDGFGIPLRESEHSMKNILLKKFISILKSERFVNDENSITKEPDFKAVTLRSPKPSQIVFGKSIKDNHRADLIEFCKKHQNEDIKKITLCDITFKDNHICLKETKEEKIMI